METPQGQPRLTIRKMCELAGVSRACYHRHEEERAPSARDAELRDRLQKHCLANRKEGYRRIYRRLRRDDCVISPRRTLKMMREDNLLSIRKNKFILPATDSNHTHRVYPNLARDAQLTAPNQLWVADITYVQLRREEVYLAVVLDVYTRVVVGWAVRRNFMAELVIAALEMALANRPAPKMHHSDRGVQYASQEYVQILESRKVTISMSRPGTPTDNAYCESFIKTLKAEQLDGRAYRDLEELEPALPTIINVFYNQKHLHSALGYQTPSEFEKSLRRRSFLRHGEIFPSDGSRAKAASLRPTAHRLDEFPVGYPLAGCSPAEPASVSPTGWPCPSNPLRWSSFFQRTATVTHFLGLKRVHHSTALSPISVRPGTWVTV